jgi:hypothetical protein
MPRSLAVIALVFVCACGGPPSAPTAPLPFQGAVALGNGRRSLTIVGDSDRCGDTRLPDTATPSVNVDVMGSSDNSGWTLRPLDATGGNFEIRIERALTSAMFGAVALTGSAQGYAVDSSTDFYHTPMGTTLTFGASDTSAIHLTGSMSIGSLASGAFQDELTFSRNGVSASCPAGTVMWSLTNSQRQ